MEEGEEVLFCFLFVGAIGEFDDDRWWRWARRWGFVGAGGLEGYIPQLGERVAPASEGDGAVGVHDDDVRVGEVGCAAGITEFWDG